MADILYTKTPSKMAAEYWLVASLGSIYYTRVQMHSYVHITVLGDQILCPTSIKEFNTTNIAFHAFEIGIEDRSVQALKRQAVK